MTCNNGPCMDSKWRYCYYMVSILEPFLTRMTQKTSDSNSLNGTCRCRPLSYDNLKGHSAELQGKIDKRSTLCKMLSVNVQSPSHLGGQNKAGLIARVPCLLKLFLCDMCLKCTLFPQFSNIRYCTFM